MLVEDYVRYDATGLAALIRTRAVSAAEVHEAAREALAAVEPRVGGLAGSAFEAPLAHDPEGLFAGAPFLLKDSGLRASGTVQRMGSRLAGDGIRADDDDHLMRRFRQAGLAALGRTAVPELSFNVSTEPLRGGPTRNPWDLRRSVGGSSGGSAALVAAGAVPLAHASDAGGSIRVPAASCGTVGLKPTRGRTPVGPTVAESVSGLGIDFAVTRTVRDTAALLDAVQGAAAGDWYAIAPPVRSYLRERDETVAGLRVALVTRAWSGVAVDREPRLVAQSVAESLAELGAHVTPATVVLDAEELHRTLVTIWSCGTAETVAALAAASKLVPGPQTCEAVTLAAAEHGRRLSALDLAGAHTGLNRAARAAARLLADVDLLITPALAEAPAPLGRFDYDDPTQDVDSWVHKIFAYAPFSTLFNIGGQPAMSLPAGMSEDGLPLGVQLVAPYGREDLLLRAAFALEQARPWCDRRPAVHPKGAACMP
jgi:amidase